MVYRKFQNLQLSGLGLGMMRLPVLEEKTAKWTKPLPRR